jgi:ornithine carbamoyltransferase
MPLGKKESIEDTAKVSAKYVDLIMARLFRQEDLEKLAENSSVPVVNGLTDLYHPCQILSDLLTIKEKKGNLAGLKLVFLGDGNNNVTHSLLLGCALAGTDIFVACPKEMQPQEKIVEMAKEIAKKSKIQITENAKEAVEEADIVYTDSWMSYHISEREKEKRLQLLKPFQVNSDIMKNAKDKAVFMNCLPAARGLEQTKEVIDGKQSIVFDQAENRLHMQKAIMLYTMGLL